MTRKQVMLTCKSIEQAVRRKMPIMLNPETAVAQKEQETAADAIVLWMITIGDCIGWDFFTPNVRNRWLASLCQCTLVPANDFLKEVDSAILHTTTFRDFRARIENQAFGSFKGLLSPLLQEIKHFFFTLDWEEEGRALKRIRTCLLFLSHLTLSDANSTEASYDKWLANMERIRSCKSLPNEHMKDWLMKQNLPSPWQFLAVHGTGSVAEQKFATTKSGRSRVRLPLTQYDKWLRVNTPAVRYYCRKCGVREPDWCYSCTTNRESRLIDVPKGLGERRIISPEPVSLMFIQQGLARALDFSQTRLKRFVDIQNQRRNSEMARRGSITGKYACFDLKSASDSVRWSFVCALFEKNKEWRKALQLCRSTHTLTPFGRMSNEHFAPMGSAMCFKIETLVFCAIVEEAFRLCNLPPDYTVYGDDIVVDDRVAPTLRKLLVAFGFIVNEDKSYTSDDPNFREACGGHWYNGADVSPVRLGRRFSGRDLTSPKNVLELVDLGNRCRALLPTVRTVLMRDLVRDYGAKILTNDCEDSSLLYTDNELYADQCTWSFKLWNQMSKRPDYHCTYRKRIVFLVSNESEADAMEREYGFRPKIRKRKVPCSIQYLPFYGNICLYSWLGKSSQRGANDLPDERQLDISWYKSEMELTTQWSRVTRPDGARLRLGACGRVYPEL